MTPQLSCRRSRQVEMRIEALGHERRCDPVRERDKRVDRQPQPLGREEFGKPLLACIQRFPPGRKRSRPRTIDKSRAPGVSRKQDAGFLEPLPDRACRKAEARLIKTRSPLAQRPHTGIQVIGIDLAAGKDQRPRGKIDLVVPLDHEDLEARIAVAQQQERGRGQGGGRFFRLIPGICHAGPCVRT